VPIHARRALESNAEILDDRRAPGRDTLFRVVASQAVECDLSVLASRVRGLQQLPRIGFWGAAEMTAQLLSWRCRQTTEAPKAWPRKLASLVTDCLASHDPLIVGALLIEAVALGEETRTPIADVRAEEPTGPKLIGTLVVERVDLIELGRQPCGDVVGAVRQPRGKSSGSIERVLALPPAMALSVIR
jgi:hypothetical protein